MTSRLNFVSQYSDGLSRSLRGRLNESIPNGCVAPTSEVRVFSFAEVKVATRSFRSDTILGKGSFGGVFKGYLDVKGSSQSKRMTPITIKKLNPVSMQGFKEWKGGSAIKPLPWVTWIKVAVGAAKGLMFVHQLGRQNVCRDFKPSNVLLAGLSNFQAFLHVSTYKMGVIIAKHLQSLVHHSYNAIISDFGLARKGPDEDRSPLTTQVIGTFRYAATTYITTGHLHVKSNVYSFRMVLVELLRGMRAFDANRPTDQQILLEGGQASSF